jgi:parallel beta-helix repeat protein
MNTKHRVLLVGIGLLLLCAFGETSSAKILTVDDSGGADFIKIQAAIDVANDGDTIYTYNGTYNESLYISKSLTLQGENSKETFVKLIQNGSSNVLVAGVGGVTISGFTMVSNKSVFNPEESHLCGIELYRVYNCNISNNIISDFWGGIGGSRFSFCNFTGNDISNNSYGIYVWNCGYSNIADNRVYSNENGIAICGASYDNTVINNGIFLNGIGVSTGNNCRFNRIYHNDFIGNDEQACNWNYQTNFWDNGYPAGGNYWSNYNSVDNFSGPYQNLTGSDGIGDDPHPIPHGSNKDSYPLMEPWYGHESQTHGYLNGDGQITPADAVIALEIIVGSRPCAITTLTIADVSGDGKVTSLDALMILQAAAGGISL